MKPHVCRKEDFIWERSSGRPIAVKYVGNYANILINHLLVIWGPGGYFSKECFAGNSVLASVEFATDIIHKVHFRNNDASAGFAFCKSLKSVRKLPPAKYTYAFMDCSELEYVSFVHLPCTDVSYAFYGCNTLKHVVDLDSRSQGYAVSLAGLPQKVNVMLSADFR